MHMVKESKGYHSRTSRTRWCTSRTWWPGRCPKGVRCAWSDQRKPYRETQTQSWRYSAMTPPGTISATVPGLEYQRQPYHKPTNYHYKKSYSWFFSFFPKQLWHTWRGTAQRSTCRRTWDPWLARSRCPNLQWNRPTRWPQMAFPASPSAETPAERGETRGVTRTCTHARGSKKPYQWNPPNMIHGNKWKKKKKKKNLDDPTSPRWRWKI